MNLAASFKNKKYIAYLDVLGFKDLIGRQDTSKLENYFKIVQNTLKEITYDKPSIKSLLISDAVILVANSNNDEFKQLVTAVQIIQSKLVNEDIWIRGAISFGEVYFNKSKGLVVGQGLVKAYLLEQNTALYPRVMIDPVIVPIVTKGAGRIDFFSSMNPQKINKVLESNRDLIHSPNEIIKKNKLVDDIFFVAYGHRVIIDAIRNRNMDTYLNIIRQNLYSNAVHYPKYLWVKNYFIDVLNDIAVRYNTLDSETNQDIFYISKSIGDFNGL